MVQGGYPLTILAVVVSCVMLQPVSVPSSHDVRPFKVRLKREVYSVRLIASVSNSEII